MHNDKLYTLDKRAGQQGSLTAFTAALEKIKVTNRSSVFCNNTQCLTIIHVTVVKISKSVTLMCGLYRTI